MILVNLLIFGIGIGAIWSGIKTCEQVHGIALVLTGLILVVWGLSAASFWLQILVELGLVVVGRFSLSWYSRVFIPNSRPTAKCFD